MLCAWALALSPREARAEDESRNLHKLTPSVAAGALDAFQTALDERWSYRHANHADFDGPIAELRKRIADISSDELGIELQKILALGIDGHSRVFGYHLPPGGCGRFSSRRRANASSPSTRILAGHRTRDDSPRARIGSIASFQAYGKLFDGNGIRPDVRMEAVPEYYIGGRDNVLEEAVKRIQSLAR
jgi:hypothetical protein